MNLSDQMQADVSDVFLNTDEHGQTVTRTPRGGGDPTSFTAIVDILESVIDEKEGKKVIHHASLMCASSVTILIEDKITIGGVDWQVNVTGLASVGMKTYKLTRTEKKSQQAGEATFK